MLAVFLPLFAFVPAGAGGCYSSVLLPAAKMTVPGACSRSEASSAAWVGMLASSGANR